MENRKGDRGRGRRREGEEQRYGAWRRCRAAVAEKKGRGERDPRRRGRSCRRATPLCLVRVSPLLFAEGETRREDADPHHRASLSSSSLHHCRSLFPLPSGFAAAAIESDAAEEESFLFRRRRRRRWLLLFIWLLESLQLELVTGGEKRLHHPLRFDIEPLFLTLIDAAAAVSVALKSLLQLPI
ncbi:uncharacterized protein LOC107621717 isoform X1 [Arachis ipaensis]|uniref:uncharacterized protein LOC107621717 isoform X1 n=1 Tax=Arachis ipaensis TaxID=130454 RepID=UPI0007AFD3BA|nr:uncharacterized protein LOC107621717 isoform X1 [Arachis ipaensis]XP_025684509.1 uncharacterized protein LOC112785265 isoform X1 [Arachis hypogaea]